MKEKNSKMLSDKHYKVGFFVLLVILVIAGVTFAITWYGDSRFNQGAALGQSSAIIGIVNTVANSGSITIQDEDSNQSFTMYSEQAVQFAQEQVYQSIMNSARAQGYVRMFDEQGEVFLQRTEVPEGFPSLEELIAEQQALQQQQGFDLEGFEPQE